MIVRMFLLAVLAISIGSAVVQGTDATVQMRRLSSVRPIITVSGTSAVCSVVDTGNHTVRGKTAAVIAAVVSGQAVVGFVRMHDTSRGLFVDIVLSDTSANMTTALNSLNITTTPTHPSPAKDACDTAVSAASGGE